MKKKQQSGWIVGLILMLVQTGCKIYQPVATPAIQTPATYKDNPPSGDTSGIHDMPWAQLYTDPFLVQLIDSTLARNLDLLRAVQRITVAQNRYYVSRAALLPRVEALVSAGADKYGNYTQNGVGNFDTNLSPNIEGKKRIPYPLTPDFFTGLQSAWEIDVWGKLRNMRKGAYARYLATREGVRFVQTSLVASVASRYYELLSLDNELEIIRSNIQLQDSALQIVQVLKQAGRANELAVQQFSAQLLNTRALEGPALQQITEVENELSLLQGHYPQAISRDTSLLAKPLPPVLRAGVPARLLSGRPDIRQAELEMTASGADIAVARAMFYPAVTLTPYLGLNAFKLPLLFTGGSFTYGLLGSLSATLFNQGALKRGLRIAEAGKMDAYYAYQQTVLASVGEVVNALNGMANARKVYDLKIQEVQALHDAVSTSNLLFKTGKASYLEVITAQRSVVEAQLQLVNSKKEMYLSGVELYRALGGGWQ